MANNVKFSTGLQDDLLKRNSDNSYVHKIENGHVYFATRENDEGETIGSIFYDVNGKRVSMGGGVAEQAKADDMKQNIADTYVTRISSEGAKYASTDGVTLTTYNGRNAVLDTILLPVAGTDRAGVVITGAQTFAGNKTFTGIIHLTNTRDADKGSDSGVLIIGDKDGSHLIFDDNEIMAKNKTNGTGVLYLNADGGTVYIGGNFLPNGTTKTLSLGSATAYWKEAYIGNVVTDTLSGHLTGSLTGNVTGNVTGHASLDLPLAGGTMTGDISFATIASWPTASGETYPIKSKGLKWSGSSDNASIYYVVEASDKGVLYLDMGDDTGGAIKFAMGGTAHTVFESNGNIYPVTTNKGSLGTSNNKFASVYATNFYGIIDKAYGDESGNNIQASYGAKLQAHTHDGNGWSFRLLNKNGGALADTLTVPGATDSKAGLITTGEQKFAGKKTFSGQVVITGGSDTSKETANSGQLIVGDPAAEHLAIDGNEIMAKASGTTVRALLFQLDGGDTKFGGNVNPYATNVHSLGTEDLAWKEAHIGEIYGHLNGSVTGTLSGNASSASKWLTARTLTIGSTGKKVDGSADVSWSRAEIGISRNFTSFKTASANTDGWYTIATIADSTTSPAVFLVRGYAHSSIVFTVTKGYDTNGSVNILDYNNSSNDGYAYVKGARLLKDGKVQIKIHTKTTAGATTSVNMHVNAFNSSDTLTLSDSLVADDSASPSVIQTREPAATGVMMANRFYGALYGTADKATNDTSGAAILDKYITRVDFAQADTSASDKTKKLNIRLYDGNNALKSTVQVPNASTTETGVVNTGTQSFAGNKTFTGRIHFSNTTDAAKGSDSGVITIGDKSGEHMLLDGNEIMAKSGASGANVLHIQAEGGTTEIGGNFIPKSQFTLGSSSNYWGNAYIKNLVADTLSGHLTGSLTGNVTGNATSATKLQTARKIILGNDLQGEVSFDGTKDVTFTAQSYCCSINGGNTQNYPWRRIATSGTITGSHNDRDMVIAIRHSYNGGGYGIAKVSLRTNNVSSNAVSQCEIRWLVRQNIAVDALQAGFRNVAGDTYADIFYKVETWPRAKVYQLQGDRTWTLISSKEADDTTTSDKKTSSEAYATIAAAATALSRTYTSTVIAVDQGYVERAYKDESGNNIKASYLASIQQVTSDKDTFTFRGFNKNNGAMSNLITIPAATASDTSNANWKAGLVTSQAQTWAGEKTFRDGIRFLNATSGFTKGINWTAGDNDYARILAGATGSNGGYFEIATADDGNEPIYVRQYTGVFSALKRTLTLLDASGNTIFPGSLNISGNIMPSVDADRDNSKGYVIGDLNTKWLDVYAQDMHVYDTIFVNTRSSGTTGGIGLYGTNGPHLKGIAYRNNLGTHGYATDSSGWNMSFNVGGGASRGWIFRNEEVISASISGEGYISANRLCLNRGINSTKSANKLNGRISWYTPAFYTWFDYMSNSEAGAAPTGGQPSQMGSITDWARRSLIENVANYGWVWESTNNAAAGSTSTQPTPRMALASDTGRLYLSNDLMIMMGDTDKFVHYLYATGAGATNYVGASWRAGVLGSGSANTNYYVIQSGTSSTANTTWENAVRIGQNNYDFTVGTTTKGGIGVANTSNSTGNGISLYGGAMPNSDGTAKSGKPTYGLFFGGTGTFGKHGYVQGDWATYFTMDSTANRGWVFLKGDTAVASINNDGKAQFNETYVTGPLKIGNNANGDTNYIAFYGTTGDNPGSFNHAYIGENLYSGTECSELVIYKGNDIAPTAAPSSPGPDRIRHIAAAHLFQIYKSALSGDWTTICDSTVPVNVFEINQSGVVVTGNSTISGNTSISGTLTVTGATTLESTLDVLSTAKFKQGSAATSTTTGAVQITGGLATTAASYMQGGITVASGNITFPNDNIITWSRNTDLAKIGFKNDSDGDADSYLYFHTADNGNEHFKFRVQSDSTITDILTLKNAAATFNGTVTATTFVGALNGNAATASKWQTARLLKIADGAKSVDGSSDVTWTPYEMRLARARYNVDNNMNRIADHGIEIGMAELNSGNTAIDPNAGTSWHHYINMTWMDCRDNNGTTSNEWCTQIANKCGTTDLWVRSRNGGSIADGTAWAAPWTRILTGSNYTSVLNSTYLPLAGGTMRASAAIKFPASAGTISTGDPMAITYGRISAYGTLCINANTDNSGTEYVILTAGKGLSSSTADGLAVGTSTLTWQGATVLTSGNYYNTTDGRYVNVSGDTMSGQLNIYCGLTGTSPGNAAIQIREVNCLGNTGTHSVAYAPRLGFHWGNRYWGQLVFFNSEFQFRSSDVNSYCPARASAFWGAVWNDYAEYRKAETLEAGRVVIEDESGEMKLSTERLQPGANVVSDTFGFAIGETDDCKTPLAVAGRVLAYPYENRNSYPLGAAVCSGPNGTISLMTREEIREYPERIIGTVSEIPTYEVWGDGNAPINGRIWIKVR